MSSTALVGVGDHDAGVASALVNTTQQVGGSLGHGPAQHGGRLGDRRLPGHPDPHPANMQAATVHGYTVGFLVGAACLTIAALSSAFLVNATRADMAAISAEAVPV